MILQDGKLVHSQKEKMLSQAGSMLMWVIFAFGLYQAIMSGRIGSIVTHIGMMLVATAVVICAPLTKVVELKEGSVSTKIITGMMLFGFMTGVTGLLIQLTQLWR